MTGRKQLANKVIQGGKFISAICELLDLNPDNIGSIVITARYDEFVDIQVNRRGDERLLQYDWEKLKKHD